MSGVEPAGSVHVESIYTVGSGGPPGRRKESHGASNRESPLRFGLGPELTPEPELRYKSCIGRNDPKSGSLSLRLGLRGSHDTPSPGNATATSRLSVSSFSCCKHGKSKIQIDKATSSILASLLGSGVPARCHTCSASPKYERV